jgi:esterase
MSLHYREYGSYSDQRPTLLLIHGLLGSSANWHSIARALSDDYHIIVPDLRNHGRSPHSPEVSYLSLAGDLHDLIDEHGLDSVVLVGHSMGGKAAMLFSLIHPDMVEGMVAVDVSPVSYPNRFNSIFSALNEIPVETLLDREQAEEMLATQLEERGLRQYLLQNLMLENGVWTWRANLGALEAGIGQIVGFPNVEKDSQYLGPALFLYGANSDYVAPEYQTTIQTLFPYARLRSVAGAGHWVYAEQPEAFLAALKAFLAGI